MPEYSFNPTGDTEAQGLGRVRWLSTGVYPTIEDFGKVANIVVVHQDITERKKSKLVFRIVWDNSASGIRITNKKGIIVKVNKAYCEMFGKTKEELEGNTLSIVYSSKESEIENIFEDFFRTETSQNISGSGLGLSIVKHYVEMYKGEIEVESKLSEGSTFKVKIPLSDKLKR